MLQGARNAVGLTVIIDVFRACTVTSYLFHNGAEAVLPVAKIDEAYRLKQDNPSFILIGERYGRKQVGFQYGNSPDEIHQIDFTGKTIIQTTSAGTQGIAHASGADEIITGCLVNAEAVAQYILQRNPLQVSLVCMGVAGRFESEEDTVCAEYIKSLLENKPYPVESAIKQLKDTSGKNFFDSENWDWAPKNDFYLCTDLNRFHFVLKAERTPEGITRLRKIEDFTK